MFDFLGNLVGGSSASKPNTPFTGSGKSYIPPTPSPANVAAQAKSAHPLLRPTLGREPQYQSAHPLLNPSPGVFNNFGKNLTRIPSRVPINPNNYSGGSQPLSQPRQIDYSQKPYEEPNQSFIEPIGEKPFANMDPDELTQISRSQHADMDESVKSYVEPVNFKQIQTKPQTSGITNSVIGDNVKPAPHLNKLPRPDANIPNSSIAPIPNPQFSQPQSQPQVKQMNAEVSTGNNALAKAANMIAGHEKFMPNAYWDYKQHSVGYGTRASSPDQTVTKQEAKTMLQDWIKKDYNRLLKKLAVDLNDNQMAALLSFSYNAGIGSAMNVVDMLNKGAYDQARNYMNSIVHAGGKKLSGLVKRREAETNQLFRGL